MRRSTKWNQKYPKGSIIEVCAKMQHGSDKGIDETQVLHSGTTFNSNDNQREVDFLEHIRHVAIEEIVKTLKEC